MMLNRDETRILNHLANVPYDGSTTCKLRTLQNIMLHTDGKLMAHGRLFDVVSKRVCPGVYRISLELKT